MNDGEVIKVIEKYLKKSIYSYAVLIDGEWGSGKTYFVKNTLMPHINKLDYTTINEKSIRFEPIYISLYGISSIEKISSQIYIQILPKTDNSAIRKIFQNKLFNKIFKNKTIKKVSNFTGKVSSDLIKFNDISVSGIIKVMMECMEFEKKFVLIFDDLERCELNVNEVLGYINNFVEHDGIKTIIIANQKEMGKINASNNLELKYLIATNKDINVDINGEKQFSDQGYLNIEKLKEKTDIIFNENYLYEQIKEKLIGITINYKADIGNILENLISEIIQNKELRQVVIENKDFLITTTSNLKHENLRTIQFAIERYSELGEIICEQECGDYKEQILKDVFRYTVYSSIRFKKDNYIKKWQGVSEMDFISEDKSKFSTIRGFRFIDIAVSQSILDKEYIADFIKKYIILIEEKYNPIDKLQAYWETEDEEIIEYLKEVEEKLKSNSINFNFYSRLIVKLIEIVDMGFNIEYLNKSIKYMESNITEESKWFRLEEFGGLPTKEKVLAEYNEKIKPLIKILERKRIGNIENDLNIYFVDGNKEDWGRKFYTYCWTNSNIFDNNQAFFSLLKIDKVIDCLKLSNSRNMSFFRYAISEVNNYNDDYSNIFKLSIELSEELVNFDGISRKYNVKLLIDSLNRKIEILKLKDDNIEEKTNES